MEASDLGVPLVGVGFISAGLLPSGSFCGRMAAEVYEKLKWTDVAIEPAMTPEGGPCVTAVPLGSRTVLMAVWRIHLGRVTLYLLDTDLEENAPWDRDLSARLYGGDRETRLQQEILLGIGGVRALKAVGAEPSVFHLNEGHAAFASLQRIRDLCEKGWAFEAALEEVRRTTVFTTHTSCCRPRCISVPHGRTHLAGAWGDLGGYRERFFQLANYDNGSGSMFNMTALALRTAGAVNGVSRVHGEVTKQMWRSVWPGASLEELPIKSVTNGVHVPTWMSSEMAGLLEKHLGPDWLDHHDDPAYCDRILGDSRRGTVAGSSVAAEFSLHVHPRARALPVDDARYGGSQNRRRRNHVRSQRADDRVRAAIYRA